MKNRYDINDFNYGISRHSFRLLFNNVMMYVGHTKSVYVATT
jgi:hypothetical protein